MMLSKDTFKSPWGLAFSWKRREENESRSVINKLEEDDFLYSHYSEESLINKAFYNVGAGDFSHRYWTNIDYSTEWYANKQTVPFININLMEEPDLPIKSDSAELFYTSHTIEHLTDSAIIKLFKEVYRSLKKDGLFRIVCPDADLLYWTLKLSRIEYWHWRRNLYLRKQYINEMDEIEIEDFVVKEIATERCRFLAINKDRTLEPAVIRDAFQDLDKDSFFNFLVSGCSFSVERPYWHINWWNEEKIRSFLVEAGFNIMIRSGYNQSIASPFHNAKLFDTRCPRISLYIDAIK